MHVDPLEQLVRVVLGGSDPAAVVEGTEGARRLLERAPAAVRHGASAGAAAAAVADRMPGGVENLASMHPLAAVALDGLKSLVLLGAGAQANAEVIRSHALATTPARPDPPLPTVDADAWPSRSRADVVVVGSGAGGALAAMVLAEAGADVVVLEEGRRWTVDELREADPLDRFGALYRDGGTTAALGLPPVMLPRGRAVGGSTLVNSGTCYRPPDAVARRWRDLHGLDAADPAHLEVHLEAVEQLLGVAPVPAEVLGPNAARALAGAAALGWSARPLDRNAPGCGGCCQCALGCPRNAKAGVHLNALPRAVAAGARLVTGAEVVRVRDGEKHATVRFRRPDGSTATLDAGLVVVAAGALESPALLLRSGFTHPRLGANLAVHPALGLAGRFAEPVRAWEGVLQSAAVEELHDDGVLIEATATPPGMGSMILPGVGDELAWWRDRQDHMAVLGAMVADEGNGWVRPVGRRALVRYRLGEREAARLRRGLLGMGEVLFAAGAEEVVTGIAGVPAARSVGELAEQAAGLDVRRLHLAAFHPTGTVAAGGDPQRHPVEPNGRLRGTRRVAVADASLIPSSPEVNPQVSIMALVRSIAADMARG